MSIKQLIIDRISEIENESILQEILALITAETEVTETYTLNPQQESKVNEGLEDISKGRTMTQEESEKFISEWLKKQSTGR
jgi:predicted transcriptional regulator